MSAAVTGTQDAGAPLAAGFGVSCRRGSSATALRYEFIDEGDGWYIEQGDGPLNTNKPTHIIQSGASSHTPGDRPVTVTGVCDTAADGKTTRLEMFIDASKVADFDVVATSADDGWLSGLMTASTYEAPSTVLVTKFVERDRSR